MEKIILVDENDNELGAMEKIEVHRKGVLHRAFSILVFNSAGELLIQQRSKVKYHSPNLWTNTCCSHPHPGESVEQAAAKRLFKEMGINLIPKFSFKFRYKVELDNGLFENEIDHVFLGKFDGVPMVNVDEVRNWKFAKISWIKHDISSNSANYTSWFKIMMDKYF